MKKNVLLFLLLVMAVTAFLMVTVFTSQVKTGNNNNAGRIAQAVECYKDADCLAGGCSGQFCLPRDKASQAYTTCEWRADYACYAENNCACRNNKCQWSDNQRFQDCLENLNK